MLVKENELIIIMQRYKLFQNEERIRFYVGFFVLCICNCNVVFFSLLPLEYAKDKSKRVCVIIYCLVIFGFSILNGWQMNINLNKIPVSSVEKEWKEYTLYCKEEHISWDELTFPEWLAIVASE